MSRRVQRNRPPLAQQLGSVVAAFLLAQFIARHVLPASAGFWPHVLVFVAAYVVSYVIAWRLTDVVRSRGPLPPGR